MRICWNFDGRTVCIGVPMLEQPFHLGPIPEMTPSPDPWVVGETIDAGLAREMQAASTAAAAVRFLPSEHRQAVKAALEATATTFERRMPHFKVHWPWSGPGPDPAT